jgi:Pyruvate/2-oxoacid:ferredoxin oxidoreductase gamma subunit
LPENEIETILALKDRPFKNAFAVGGLFKLVDIEEAKRKLEKAKLGQSIAS